MYLERLTKRKIITDVCSITLEFMIGFLKVEFEKRGYMPVWTGVSESNPSCAGAIYVGSKLCYDSFCGR